MKKRHFAAILGMGLGIFLCYEWHAAPTFPTFPQSDHYHQATQQFHNNPPTRPTKSGVAAELWKMLHSPQVYRPPALLPMQQPDWQAFFAPSSQTKWIWFGHSTLLMRANGQTILIDPVYAKYVSPVPVMMARFQAPPVALEALPPIDWVVYSHAHYDHLDRDVVEYLIENQPKTQFLTPLGVGSYLQQWGVPKHQIRELDWWQNFETSGIRFHAVPARHNAARTPFDKNRSLWAGWVFETATEKIYFSGDSSDGAHFEEIGARFAGVDLAFIENGQYNMLWEDNHLFPEESVQAALRVRAKRWMPIHWGAYALSTHGWADSVRESQRHAKAHQLPMLTPIMGQVFDRDTPTDAWWEKVVP